MWKILQAQLRRGMATDITWQSWHQEVRWVSMLLLVSHLAFVSDVLPVLGVVVVLVSSSPRPSILGTSSVNVKNTYR